MKPGPPVWAALVAVGAGLAAGPGLAESTRLDPPTWQQVARPSAEPPAQPTWSDATSAVGMPLSLTQEHESRPVQLEPQPVAAGRCTRAPGNQFSPPERGAPFWIQTERTSYAWHECRPGGNPRAGE